MIITHLDLDYTAWMQGAVHYSTVYSTVHTDIGTHTHYIYIIFYFFNVQKLHCTRIRDTEVEDVRVRRKASVQEL